jgi:hypothetical protein
MARYLGSPGDVPAELPLGRRSWDGPQDD